MDPASEKPLVVLGRANIAEDCSNELEFGSVIAESSRVRAGS